MTAVSDRRTPDREEVVHPDLETDGEEQDDDADLRQDVGRLARDDEGQRVRPDDEPAEQLADDGRLPEATRDLLAQFGGDEQDEQADHHVERGARCVCDRVAGHRRERDGEWHPDGSYR